MAATGPALSVRVSEPELVAEVPALRRESDGRSVFVAHGADRFTTSEVLLAEDRLLAAAPSTDAPRGDETVLEASLAIEDSRTGITLDAGQRSLVDAFATSKAAQVLGSELGLRAENVHKFLHENRVAGTGDAWYALRSGDVVLVDEAGMAGTLHLDAPRALAKEADATVRLLGDPSQLAAVDVGGALDLLDHDAGLGDPTTAPINARCPGCRGVHLGSPSPVSNARSPPAWHGQRRAGGRDIRACCRSPSGVCARSAR